MKILIVKIGAIGDVLMARGMPAAAPQGSHITWVCGRSVAPLVREFPGVNEVLEIDDAALLQGGAWARLKVFAGLWASLMGRRFDLVATGHSDWRYGMLSLGTLAGLRRSFASQPLVPGRYHADEYARLIHGITGPLAPKAILLPMRPARGRGKTALLFPGGAKNLLRDDALRRWPLAHYAQLAKLLCAKGWRVTLGGSESDRWVLPAFASLPVASKIGETDLKATLDLCAASSVVVSHDSGPLHMAMATPSRVVAIFGPTSPLEKLRPGQGLSLLWGGETLACRPCYDGRNYAACDNNVCMAATTPTRVMAAIEGKQ
jgi:heptosyltransferase-2